MISNTEKNSGFSSGNNHISTPTVITTTGETIGSSLALEPFHHQVAGQSLVFRYDVGTICKSLIPRELEFYKTMPDVLKPHVPEYRGVVDIRLVDDSCSDSERRDAEGGFTHPLTTQRLLNKVAKSRARDGVYHFILLENLVADFQKPCILDLKLGTRQHGDDAPSHKVEYQINKCRSTTSAHLGTRLCGMKVYQTISGEYVEIDKAEGRRMRKDDFLEAMFHYLFNGRRFRRDLIPSLVQQLQSLKATVNQLPTYRFYSCSLLIAYDGAEQCHDCHHTTLTTNCQQDHSSDVCKYSKLNRDLSLVTSGALMNKLLQGDSDVDRSVTKLPDRHKISLDHKVNTQSISTNMNVPEPQAPQCLPSVKCLQNCSSRLFNENIPVFLDGTSNGNSHCFSSEAADGDNVCRNYIPDDLPGGATRTGSTISGKVVVRMVDFAHTTYAGFLQDKTIHEGVDQGCLLGLQTLIDIFTQLYTKDQC